MITIRLELINSQGQVTERKDVKSEDVLGCVVYGELEKQLLKQEKKINKVCKQKT